MTSRRSHSVLGGPGAVAGCGILVAHWVAYLAVAPEEHRRASLLMETGHRLWPLVVALTLAFAAGGLHHFLQQSWKDESSSRILRIPRTFGHLCLLQLAGFATLELGERALFHVGESPFEVIMEPVVLLGLLLQVVAALVGTAVLLLLAKAIVCLKTLMSLSSVPRTRVMDARLAPVAENRLSPLAGAAGLRGPPLIVIA